MSITEKPYTRFFSRLLLFCLLVFILDLSIGKTLAHFYFSQTSGLQYRTTYAMEKTKADILVFGSSRANHHYKPETFEKNLRASYYNVGRDGCFIFYHYAVLKSVLSRYSPKIIILDINAREFSEDIGQESYERLSCLLPYYKNHPEIRSVIELKSKAEKIKLFSNVYPYNSSLFTIAVGNTEFNKARKQDDKGYIPLSGILPKSQQKSVATSNYRFDQVKMDYYQSFLDDCISKNIQLFVVCSPYSGGLESGDITITRAKKIAEKKNVKFCDFSNDSTFLHHPEFFADIYHLNDSGAKVFTAKIVDALNRTAHRTNTN